MAGEVVGSSSHQGRTSSPEGNMALLREIRAVGEGFRRFVGYHWEKSVDTAEEA
jgi:hypothetical protein